MSKCIQIGKKRKKVYLTFSLPRYIKGYFCLIPTIGCCWASEENGAHLFHWDWQIDINVAWLKWSGTILMITD